MNNFRFTEQLIVELHQRLIARPPSADNDFNTHSINAEIALKITRKLFF